MDGHEMHVTRPPVYSPLRRGGSICVPDKEMQLLSALRHRHIHTFYEILNSSSTDVNQCYDFPDFKRLLEIACCEHKLEFVDALLKAGANPNIINTQHKRAALHFAIERAEVEIVKRLLQEPKIDVNIMSKGNTPLVLLVKQIEDDENNKDKYVKCIDLLLKQNADVNIPDAKGITAIYLAAKNGYTKIISLLLEHSKIHVDLDSYKDRSGKSARDLILSKNLYVKALPEYNDKRVQGVSHLFVLLSQGKEEEFTELLRNLINTKGNDIVNANNGLFTLLQLACDKGLEKSVKKLLNKGADVNLTNPNKEYAPIELVCEQGYHEILKLLLETKTIQVIPTIIHTITKNINTKNRNPKSDYGICLDLLVNDPRVNVNAIDEKGSTALHYAARNSDHDSIVWLLRAGACVSIRNDFGEPPLADIPPKILENFLDECLTENGKRCTDDDYELIFNYEFLAPPNIRTTDNQCSYDVTDDSEIQQFDTLAPETDALKYMTENQELKHLLKHPVITSFLFLKWHRISWIFYINLTFYILFCSSLIGYILFGYGQPIESPEHVTTINVLSVFLTIGAVILVCREVFQLFMSPSIYLMNVENWLEMPLMAVTFNIVFHEPQEHIRQQLSAIAILLSAAELVLFIGQHPKLSTNIVMLRTVSWNFFKFLLWYSILIVAFALSFYTLFREIKPENKNITVIEKETEDGDFFLNPGMSLFKTIVMLTGEFDAGSINFNTFPVTSHIIFVLFVFLIAIVLFNLLNGLAVNDTKIIREDAELVGYISRINAISYYESMILGEIVPLKKLCQTLFCCLQPNIQSTAICLKPLADRICLFPKYLPQYKAAVKPNKNRKIMYSPDKKEASADVNVGCGMFSWCKELRMDSTITKAAKVLAARKSEMTEFDELKASLIDLHKFIKTKCESIETKNETQIKHMAEEIAKITKLISNSNGQSDNSVE